MDRYLSDLTDGLPGWLGIAFVVVLVGAGWFGIAKLGAQAARRSEKGAALAAQRRWAKGLRPRYARSPERLAGDPDAFALAASAWLAQASGQSLDAFAYDDADALRRRILPEHYGVHDRASLLAKLRELLISGHRRHPHGDERGAIDFVPWDLVRVIELARAGVGLGAMDERSGRDIARFAARVVQSRMGGWAEFGDAFERAFRHSHERVTAHARRLADIECGAYRRILDAPDGPWARVGWDTRVARSELALLEELEPVGAGERPGEPWERPLFAALGARREPDNRA